MDGLSMDGPGPGPAQPELENGWANGSSPCRPGLPGQGTVVPVAGAPASGCVFRRPAGFPIPDLLSERGSIVR